MRTHFCVADGDWITFEGECSWCGMKEHEPFPPQTSDTEFRQLMAKLEADANPNINDD